MTLPTPPRVTPSVLPDCPFVAGPMIRDSRLFVGRRDLLQSFTTLMTGVQPTSINLVGERRIGKSSLLYHFFQTWEQRVQDVNRYVVVYLSLQEANCQSRNGFYQAVAQELLSRPFVRKRKNLTASLSAGVTNDSAFANALAQWKQQMVLPVLCLDEFEALLEYRTEFNNGFYNHLRSLMDKNALMLILTSHKPIDVYQQQYGLTSSFFNIGHVLYLEKLTEEEANDLVRLPASTVPGTTPALNVEDQQLASQLGETHPHLLQLAASFLCQAQKQGNNTTWAKKQFDIEKRRLYEPASPVPNWWPPVRWLVWRLPIRLGRLGKRVGENSNKLKDWTIGIAVVAVVILGAILTIFRLIQWLLKLLGVGG